MAGVFAYNHFQERASRRAAETAFGGARPDALLDAAPRAREVRVEPSIEKAAAAVQGTGSALPDSRVDYVMHLTPQAPVDPALLAEAFQHLGIRFAGRVLLAGSDGDGWRALEDGASGSCTALQIALQLVSRDGVMAEAELLEFRAQVEALAARIGAGVAAPEMRQALEGARALDAACADADIQVALHVVGIGSQELVQPAPFQFTERADGVTLSMDLGRTPDPARAYEAMARAATQLATRDGGRVVDDNGRPLDERALAAIAVQVGVLRDALAAHGIEAGSPLALRVFS